MNAGWTPKWIWEHGCNATRIMNRITRIILVIILVILMIILVILLIILVAYHPWSSCDLPIPPKNLAEWAGEV